jgi:hypothetical protein
MWKWYPAVIVVILNLSSFNLALKVYWEHFKAVKKAVLEVIGNFHFCFVNRLITRSLHRYGDALQLINLFYYCRVRL